MQMELLLDYMNMWSRYMKSEDNSLGYPKRSLGIATGASTSFDEMIDAADNHVIRIINAVLDSLPKEQRDAIWYRYLGTKKPMYYELKLQDAMDNLLLIVGRRLAI